MTPIRFGTRIVAAALLAVICLAPLGCGGPTSCSRDEPIFHQGSCYSERSIAEAFACPGSGRVMVLREPPIRWDVCCQDDRNQTHCVEYVRGEGPVDEHWICPPDKSFSERPCASEAAER